MTRNQTQANQVREHYGKIAKEGGSCCAPSAGCCGPGDAQTASQTMGYSATELAALPDGANMGLGCGNPQAIAGLAPGETVLDLGSGGGIDCFLAARQVGAKGHVIGVDMTPEMINKARTNAAKLGLENVEFRMGEIERLPVADNSVDVILSNCVINLSADKAAVFREAFRVLKPSGRLAIMDVVRTGELPEAVKKDAAALSACVSGASEISQIKAWLRAAGFAEVRVTPKEQSREMISGWGFADGGVLVSASIEAVKAAENCCAPGCCGGAA